MRTITNIIGDTMVSMLKGHGFDQVNELWKGAKVAAKDKKPDQVKRITNELTELAKSHIRAVQTPAKVTIEPKDQHGGWLAGHARVPNKTMEDDAWHAQMARYIEGVIKDIKKLK